MYRRNDVTGLEVFGAVILLILIVLVSPVRRILLRLVDRVDN